jgi:hypothetical protein
LTPERSALPEKKAKPGPGRDERAMRLRNAITFNRAYVLQLPGFATRITLISRPLLGTCQKLQFAGASRY